MIFGIFWIKRNMAIYGIFLTFMCVILFLFKGYDFLFLNKEDLDFELKTHCKRIKDRGFAFLKPSKVSKSNQSNQIPDCTGMS